MAVIRGNLLQGDGTPAFVCQVIEIVNKCPPVRPCDLGPACFPGYMVNCVDRDEWKRRLADLDREIDSRMQVLHLGNFIWRREINNRDKLVQAKEPMYYRRNERRKIAELPDEVLWLPFHEIKPLKDERFPSFD